MKNATKIFIGGNALWIGLWPIRKAFRFSREISANVSKLNILKVDDALAAMATPENEALAVEMIESALRSGRNDEQAIKAALEDADIGTLGEIFTLNFSFISATARTAGSPTTQNSESSAPPSEQPAQQA